MEIPICPRGTTTTPPLPHQAMDHDAGYDLTAQESVIIPPQGRAVVSTGWAVGIPAGYVGLIMSRSGLARNAGVIVLNAPGVIDPGYRGEVQIILHNTDPHTRHLVEPGDRIAQIVIVRTAHVEWSVVDQLSDSVRGEAGFGSSGTGSGGQRPI